MKKITLVLLGLIIISVFSACSNSEKNSNDVKTKNNDELVNSEAIDEINTALNTIVNSPSASSNPYDYVKTHQTEFNAIVKQGNTSLDYLITEFSKSNSNGLKEYIMALACIEILGKHNKVENWSSGREWYELYLNS